MTEASGSARVRMGAVVLAAGQSRRMGQPKLVLPWGDRTVIEWIVGELERAGTDEIVVVTGAARELVETALSGAVVKLVHNPDFARSEMTTSLQIGIRALDPSLDALLIALGDQPTIEQAVARQIIDAFQTRRARLVIPSYQMRRGHPWLVERSLWAALLAMPPEETMRDFLHTYADQIEYVNVDSPGILKDLDTPEDYQRLRPG